ncbi:alpha-L-fucosidase [Granulicella pectinivorans]|uniref:alpha-L-fucosidase n=1 Tax=Granulicella pectinivorans TaxID=474950 RepID=A0A1I6M4C0_9BACT|nr:alpha-L-fucosidase [Granulicella pectinivorans]SFS10519.1 alpha-L-fucosidase [Granulicella pectinivorans]
MSSSFISRRSMLLGTGAAVASLGVSSDAFAQAAPPAQTAGERDAFPVPPTPDQIRRMAWWHEAKFGMFIHFGLYSQHARHEWAMEQEAIPIQEYMPLAQEFKPTPGAARAWARLAKAAGMKYMVLTTKHHEGFCNFDSKLTDYCATKQGPKHDIVREYVDAARAEGLHVGFYYSLMDWHHPDGAKCATDEAARKRFVAYTHGLIREILTNYGKIDVLWYDVSWPLDAKGWESEKMNKMVFELQPDIIVNNRNHLQGDFSTPEQKIVAETNGRAWESCMTLNDSWGYQRADDDWKSAKTIVRNLITCARDGGNYLLNIGPRPDGSIPEETVRVLTEVGAWMETNGDTIRKSEICQPRRSNYASFTRTGNTLYMHVYYWPGTDVAISGLQTTVKSARILKTNAAVTVSQDPYRVHLTGLPIDAPDAPVTTIVLECESEPKQDTNFVRINKPRAGV